MQYDNGHELKFCDMVVLFVLCVFCIKFFPDIFLLLCLSLNGIIKMAFVRYGFFLGSMLAISGCVSGSETILAYVLRGVFDVH